VALSVGLVPAFNNAVVIGIFMIVVGFGAGVMTLYFQITMSDYTSMAERGSALALGGLGWGFSHLTTPLVMGYLADHIGLVPGFYVLGAFAVVWTVSLALMRKWAFARPKPAVK
jgi:MFS family permease